MYKHTHLVRSSRNAGRKLGGADSFKYKLECSSRVSTDNPTTQDWLTIERLLSSDKSHQVLLAKLLQLNKAVVVKFGLPNEIQIDYEIGNIVKDIPNMIKYYCKFTCNDTVTNLVSQDYRLKPFICNGTGLQLGFIIMPYYAHGDLNSFKWTRASFSVLKNVLKQVVTSLLHAFDKHSFVHGDLHLMNILLRKTKKTSLVYGSHSVAIADSYYAIIMDYGKSQIIPNGTLELLRDLQVLFGCLPSLEASDIIINTVDMSRITRLLQQQKASTLHHTVYDEAWRMIDTMTILYAKSERPPVPNFQSMNWSSFSGATLSGGFSAESARTRFTTSSVERLKKINLDNIEFHNMDCVPFIEQYSAQGYIYLDPPYMLEGNGNKLYGKQGDMHETFQHDKLFEVLQDKASWVMSYNDASTIREMYKSYKIEEAEWAYGMNKTKRSSEVVIQPL